MTRKAQDDGRKSQDYDLGGDVSITISYPKDAKPPILLEDDTCIVSLDRDKFAACVRGLRYDDGDSQGAYPVRPVVRGGPSRVLSPEARREALDRIGEGSPDPPKVAPLTSADLFRGIGLDTSILAAIEKGAEQG